MLEFINDPPESPEDVRLSKRGEFLLVDAYHFRADKTALEAYGRAACAELIDRLDVAPDQEGFGSYSRKIRDQATILLSKGGPDHDADRLSNTGYAFIEGMNFVELAFFENSERSVAA